MSQSEPLLAVRDLRIAFPTPSGRLTAVDGLSFSLERGRTFGIVGASGSGKSMTALAVAGLLPRLRGLSIEGSIRFDGRELTSLDEKGWRPLRGRRIAVVFQDAVSALNPFHRIGSQIIEGLGSRGVKGAAAHEESLALLAEMEFDDPGRIARAYPHELSGGQRQRALLAAALAGNPDLLVADEPTTALDAIVQAQVLDLLRRLQQRRGMSMLFISHDLPVVCSLADHVAVLRQGRVLAVGPTARVLGHSAPADAARSNDARLAPFRHAAPSAMHRQPIIVAERLGLTYPGRTGGRPLQALDEVSFSVQESETLAIVGESGSGKSTLAMILLGLLQPSRGVLRVAGTPPPSVSSPGRRAFTRLCQYVAQDPSAALNPRLTIARSLAEPFLIHGLPVSRERLEQLMIDLGLETMHLDRHPHELSGGQRQRVCIARALALEPKILICDEPVASLDFEVRDQVLDLIAALGRQRGLTVIFISHDLAAVRSISERVLVLRAGKVVENQSTAELFARPTQAYTRALLDASIGLAPRVTPRSSASDSMDAHRWEETVS